MPHILIVDAEYLVAVDLKDILQEYRSVSAVVATPQQALSVVNEGVFDMAFIDAKLDTGVLLPLTSELFKSACLVVLMTTELSEAMSSAKDGLFLQKPFTELHVLDVYDKAAKALPI